MVIPVLNIGVGLFILIILWMVTTFVVIGLAAVPRAKVRYTIPAVVLLCLVITISFVVYPKGPEQISSSKDVDTVFFGRLVLLLILFAFSIAGCAVTILHFFEPVDSKPL